MLSSSMTRFLPFHSELRTPNSELYRVLHFLPRNLPDRRAEIERQRDGRANGRLQDLEGELHHGVGRGAVLYI